MIWGVSIGTLHSSPPSIIAVLKHVFVLRIEGPKVALSLAAAFPGHLDKAFV